jgi:hypothetical protein
VSPVEKYLERLVEIRSSGDATDETSYYSALDNLLNEVGKELKPRVRCILQLKNRGAGHPDGGLYTPDQFQKGDEPIAGQKPARGALEVKPTKDDAFVTADTEQVTKYWKAYGQVLVTNYRDFVLVGRDVEGKPVKLASYRLASDEKAFWKAAAQPAKAAKEQGGRFVDFLKLAMLSPAVLAAPKDVAWVLAYYAREAKARIDEHSSLSALSTVRAALEQALGLKFQDERGEHFFRSSLVQTLFYGVFSAWVLWSKQHLPTSKERFDWKLAQWTLRVPMIRTLFEQVATPDQLGPLRLVEILDWTATALNRVDRADFFTRFQEQEAVQYFYEPFLEAFDPELRKELGVWFTPTEIVKYMVARTDRVLRQELKLKDGLADKNVFILDPACGTGAYLLEVVKTIQATLSSKGSDALAAHILKRIAMERVFGFELLPAPFVISHLQLGLFLQNIGAPLSDDGEERVGVYLTNSLTGWEPPAGPKQHLIFSTMEAERDAAEKVKREAPILVVIGNPPYNGFAGVGIAEERTISTAYRTAKRVASPQGQGLNDLYVRFFRLAERKIIEGNGSGVVCLISNYSWLDGLSHTGMRERYLEAFQQIWIDNLHGDRIISEYNPDGETSETVFAIQGKSPGIKVGTAIALLVATNEKHGQARLLYRDLNQARAAERRQALLESIKSNNIEGEYVSVDPILDIGLPFKPGSVGNLYLRWPLITDLFPIGFPGVKTSRDAFLVDMSRESLESRLILYFDPQMSNASIKSAYSDVMTDTPRFAAEETRDHLLARGRELGTLLRYVYRPFDVRWLFWYPETKLLDEKRLEYFKNRHPDNLWLVSQQRPRRLWSRPLIISQMGCLDLMDRGSTCIPLLLPNSPDQGHVFESRAGTDRRVTINLTPSAKEYVNMVGLEGRERSLFYHIMAVTHAPEYFRENEGALKQDWPRVPLPAALAILESSSLLGSRVAALADTELEVEGVNAGSVSHELRLIATLRKVRFDSVEPGPDLEITVGWGRLDAEGRVSAGGGKIIERSYTPDEIKALKKGAETQGTTLEQVLRQIGEQTCDVYLNQTVYWSNVPFKVWHYTLGGYQVLKKWLSYREKKILHRHITPEEVHYFRDMTRRIVAICLLQPALDANYAAVKTDTYLWPVQVKQTDAKQVNE